MRSFALLLEIDRWHPGDQPAFQHLGTAAPRHDLIARPGKELLPLDQSGGGTVGVEPAKDVSPGAVAPDRRAQAPIAVGKAAHAPHGNARSFGCAGRRLGQAKSGGRAFFWLALAAAGDADID